MNGPDNLDRLDKKILQVVQDEFPLVPLVWEVLGKRVGIPARDVFDRVKHLQDAGFIRAISPIMESAKITTRVSTLVGVRVPAGRVRDVAAIISEYPGVSHNYERRHEFNVWFTLSAPDRVELDRTLTGIRKRSGLSPEDFLDLPITKRFKIDVRYAIESEKGGVNYG